MKMIGNYKIYLDDREADDWKDACLRDYCIVDGPKVEIIENGIVLPLKYDSGYRFTGVGGVCDSDGNFIAGHKSGGNSQDETLISVERGYDIPSEIECANETVVYGGLLFGHFGHFITECLSRMWWFIKNPNTGYRFVFITPEHNWSVFHGNKLLKYFFMLGLKEEDIIILRKPTRFNQIIVPQQTTFFMDGYISAAAVVYNAIRDSVTAAGYDKIYFTRRMLPNADVVNEEYFENYFQSKGYKIIAPEKLSIREQVEVIAGAKEIACVNGTLHHQILFAQEGIKITVLNRFSFLHDELSAKAWRISRLSITHWINQLKKANCVYIDVSANFLPYRDAGSIYLLMPNANWKSYIADFFNDSLHDTDVRACKQGVLQYIENWCKSISKISPNLFFLYSRNWMSLVDFTARFHEYVLEEELDKSIEDGLKSVLDDKRKKILYGAGYYGGIALNFYEFDRVYAFADANKQETEYLGKQIINPSALRGLDEEYDIIICIKDYINIIEYLQGMGVNKFRVFCKIKKVT